MEVSLTWCLVFQCFCLVIIEEAHMKMSINLNLKVLSVSYSSFYSMRLRFCPREDSGSQHLKLYEPISTKYKAAVKICSLATIKRILALFLYVLSPWPQSLATPLLLINIPPEVSDSQDLRAILQHGLLWPNPPFLQSYSTTQ